MLSTNLKKLRDDTSGATAIEYGLIASLIVIGMMGALGLFAGSAIGTWERVADEVAEASGN
ncbi:Flp family type IVb pilin [Porphyrobacter sp. AAP60]|uniref:Flp family type IVb pilin n=1 Tax=Porphyrobacter sp. AAP60 TaxID=1523423 RepID=UPI0006B8B555|nr:Flp family type IVb pilin [Porphyrobacter sp. AAP60]KPF65020.1 hypothetical protein IP79_02075 [Porphyrobacter sp. AAP60]